MPADQVLKFGADTTEYIAKTSQMQGAHKGINREIETGGLLVEKMTKGMERTLFKSVSLLAALKAISHEFEKQRQFQADLSKDVTANRMASAGSLIDVVGANGMQAYESAIEGGKGIASEDQKRNIIKAFQKVKKKRPISSRMMATAFNAYAAGGEVLTPESDLIDIMERSDDDTFQQNIDAYVTKRMGVTAEDHARNQGTPMEDAYFKLPESYKSIIRAQNRERVARYGDIQQIVDSGLGTSRAEVQAQYDRDSRNSMAVGVFRAVADYVPGATEMGLRSTASQMNQDEATESLRILKQQSMRKTIRHDAHGESQ